MTEAEEILLVAGGQSTIIPVDTLPADGSVYGPLVQYYKYPVVSVLPTTVVNGQSWVLNSPRVEYKGVGGVWVEQEKTTKGVWLWFIDVWVLTSDQWLNYSDDELLTYSDGSYLT